MPRHLLTAASLVVAIAMATVACPPASADPLSFQPEIGLPTSSFSLIGTSPGEAPGETWAQGPLGGSAKVEGKTIAAGTKVLLRYTIQSGGWQIVPVDNSQGELFEVDWTTGQATTDGGLVLAGSSEPESKGEPILLTRNPGGAFAKVPVPSATPTAAEPTPVLGPEERPFGTLMAALDESNRLTGILIVPEQAPQPSGSGGTSGSSGAGSEPIPPGVLHYSGSSWTREPICEQYASEKCTAPSGTLTMRALSASSPGNAWLLAGTSAEPLMLFQRTQEQEGKVVWLRRKPANWQLGSVPAPASEEQAYPLSGGGQQLTAVGEGVWVDTEIRDGPSRGDATVLVSPVTGGEVAGNWCYPTSLCPGDGSLGAALPSGYSSFAFAGAGTRIIAGLPEGALLILHEGQGEFAYTAGGGGFGHGNAAFSSPEEGWLAAGGTPATIHVTTTPAPEQLFSWPAPFRRPLLAIAAQPGSTPGEGSAQALAVGADGEVARYIPGAGWTPEYLYNSNGELQTPNLRGVAWPEAGRAYAVGDEGAMWLWQSSTQQWETDPAAPIGFRGQLTGIAFSPIEPSVGYAVGKQGVLLSYGKSWTPEAPPAGLSQANFTSVAFAGGEAIATYRMLNSDGSGEIGGLIVNDGSGWRLEPSAQALGDPILSKVAGLPDGGAVAAGPGIVIERDSATGPWHLSPEPLPEAQNVAALAAVEEGPSVGTLLSLDTNDNPKTDPTYEEIDNPPGPALNQYGVLLKPDPLPQDGYLLRQTSTGWQDVEHGTYPEPYGNDLPGWPDAVLALLIDPNGSQGWAVGGQTGAVTGASSISESAQTAAVMRYGQDNPASPQGTDAAIPLPAGQVSFAVGGNAQCASSCVNFSNEKLGPNEWLTHAISRAGQIPGLQAFLYTGARIAPGAVSSLELQEYANLLGSGGALPVYAAISPSDVSTGSNAAAFTAELGAHAGNGSVPAGTPPPPPGSAAYAVETGSGDNRVRVIVLDDSQTEVSPDESSHASCPSPSEWSTPYGQLQWLCAQLHYAQQENVAAIVMGNGGVGYPSPISQVLLGQGSPYQEGQASAYLFDSNGENVYHTIGTGTRTLPLYGSGTLGYDNGPTGSNSDTTGYDPDSSGFLTLSVNVAERNASTDRAPVSVSLIPNIGQLGLNATNGTLVRRSQLTLFEGLARRPFGGSERIRGGGGDVLGAAPDPYIPIPSCESNCGQTIQPAYSFSSSKPDIGDFVEPEPSSTNPRSVLQLNGKPVPDEPLLNSQGQPIEEKGHFLNARHEALSEEQAGRSALFCAYNAGTTTVTLTTGGLTYSEHVTVEGGSVEQPCGTVPLLNPPSAEESKSAPTVEAPPPTESPPGTEPFLSLTPPPPPQPPAPAAPAAVHHHPLAATVPALLAPVPLLAPLRAALPPPPPQAARPTPPSGTSAVEALEREREEQGAVDVVHNAAMYEPGGNALPPGWPLALIVLAAGIGAGVRRRPGRRAALARASTRPRSDVRRRRR